MPGALRAGRVVAGAWVAGAVIAVVLPEAAPGVAVEAAPGVARAAAASRAFRYTCDFGLLGGQAMTGSVAWDVSDTHVVGRPTPRLPVDASATVGGLVPGGLRTIGATSLAGTAKVHAVVAAPQGDVDVTVPMDVPVTQIPASGALTVPAHGTAPSLTFTQPGTARIVAGDIELRVTPRKADGSETVAGTVNASCDLDPDQDRVLSSFLIRSAQTSPAPTGAGSGAGGGSGAGSGAGAGSGSGGGAGTGGPGAGAGPDGGGGSGSGAASGVGAGGGSGAEGGGSQGSSRSGVPRSAGPGTPVTPGGTASAPPSPSASAAAGGAPTFARPEADSHDRTRAQERTALPAPLRAAVAVLVVAGAAGGGALWFRRRRGDDG